MSVQGFYHYLKWKILTWTVNWYLVQIEISNCPLEYHNKGWSKRLEFYFCSSVMMKNLHNIYNSCTRLLSIFKVKNFNLDWGLIPRLKFGTVYLNIIRECFARTVTWSMLTIIPPRQHIRFSLESFFPLFCLDPSNYTTGTHHR